MHDSNELSGMKTRLQELGDRVAECSTQMQKLRSEISFLVREMADAMVQLSEVETSSAREACHERAGCA